ncbi:putative aspartic proteinase nepenthesin-2-like [Capsicum annuum]|nr:putative aspartic proteinase nepenthesin-2-like [Capsicum annuum]
MSLDPMKLPDPPLPSYTFTIYHRDIFEKSNFKNYDSLLESRLAQCHARARYLALAHESKNGSLGGDMLELVPKSTDTYNNGEYVASFLIGSQMIKNYLLVDTGSDLLWWQCGPCEANKCYYQHQPLYNSTASKTFRKVDCDQHGFKCKTDDPHFYCNLQSFECKYDVEYTDGSSVKGFIADDVITFVLDNRPIRVMFGCSKDQTGHFLASSSGVVGLGRDVSRGYSLPSQFGGT